MPDTEQTDGVVTLRERVRERLGFLAYWWAVDTLGAPSVGAEDLDKLADAILREFALRPVSQGVVNSDTEEAEWV